MTPLTLAASYPDEAATLTVYVSGASEMNANRPLASVVVRADCEGLCTLTAAPATGRFDCVSTTVPLIAPVVPAGALSGAWSASIANTSSATTP